MSDPRPASLLFRFPTLHAPTQSTGSCPARPAAAHSTMPRATMHAAVLDFGTWGYENTIAAGPLAPALQPWPEEPSAKLHKPMAVALPLPLTEAVVAKALAELSQGAAAALESCLECYRSKRMSSADLLSFARSTSIHSPSLAAVFKVKDASTAPAGDGVAQRARSPRVSRR